MNDAIRNRLKGGLYGALLGDAVGVPYEFTPEHKIPSLIRIDVIPPADFNRAWARIAPGTYSDDGAQVLILLEELLDQRADGTFNSDTFMYAMSRWAKHGYMSVDRDTFDVGNQTQAAITAFDSGLSVVSLNKEHFNGNGALMRTIAVALAHWNAPESLIADLAVAHTVCTHPHAISQVCSVIVSIMASRLIAGFAVDEALGAAIRVVNDRFEGGEYQYSKDVVLKYSDPLRGTGYVTNSMWSAIAAVRNSASYQDAVRLAIAYGNDTDTTACIAGALAGCLYGFNSLPGRWMRYLKGRSNIDPIAAKLVHAGS